VLEKHALPLSWCLPDSRLVRREEAFLGEGVGGVVSFPRPHPFLPAGKGNAG